MKSVTSFIKKLLLASLLLPVAAFAQVDSTPNTFASSTPSELLSEINVSYAEVVQTGDKYRVNFLIQNFGSKAESDLQYGIELVRVAEDGGKALADAVVYRVDSTVMPGASLPVLTEHTIGNLAAGKYEVWIMVRTPGGLTVGVSRAGEITSTATDAILIKSESCSIAIKGDEKEYYIDQGVDFAASEEVTVSCPVKNHSAIARSLVSVFETHERSIYGDLVAVEYPSIQAFELASGEEKTISFALPKATLPQAYDLVFSLKDSATALLSNKAVIHYVLQGQSATIQSVNFDKAVYVANDVMKIKVLWSESADTFVGARTAGTAKTEAYIFNVTVKGDDGVVCATEKIAVPKDSLAELSLVTKTDCDYPTATVSIETASGKTLDSKDVTIKNNEVPIVGDEAMSDGSKRNKLMFVPIVLFGIIGVVGLLAYFRKRKIHIVDGVKSLTVFVFLGFSIFGAAPAEAASWGTYGTYCDEGIGGCTTTHLLTGTVNPNKYVYSPNETIYLSGLIQNHMCSNNWGDNEIHMEASLAYNPNIFLFMGHLHGAYGLNAAFTAPPVPGVYTMIFNMCAGNGAYCGTAYINITVSNPAINGSCSPAAYQCYAGSPVNGSSNAYQYTWNCAGAYGGSSPACTAPIPPINGSCSATRYACTAGGAINGSDNPTNYTWNCAGAYGGATASCSETKIAGSCGATQNSCTAGSASGSSQNATHYTWSCNSPNGGTNASCSFAIPPTLTLNANPTLVGPGGSSLLTWTSTYVTACTATGAWAGSKSTSGTESVTPSSTSNYVLTCTGAGGSINQTATVSYPSGTISATGCSIPNEGSSCSSLVRWSSTNLLGAAGVFLGSTNISSLTNNAGGTNYQVNPSNRTFKLDDLGSSFEATAIADVSCASGLVWASSLGRCVVEPTVNVDVTPDVIRSNNTASVSISVDSTYDLTCTLSGGINQTISHTGSATPQTYTATTAPLTSAQIVTSTCVASVSSDIVGEGEGRVEVIPVIQEI